MATSVFLVPAPINVTQFIPGGAVPASGGKLFGYLAGTSTKQAMYVDNTGTTQWSNPIILDSGGNLTGSKEVWMAGGIPMKFVLAPSNDTDPPLAPYWSVDNISGVNDATLTSTEWIGGPTPTFISATQFSLVGDQTLIFTVNRRVKSTNTAGIIFSTISVSSFGGGITTITVVNDSGTLDAGLSAVFYGLIPPTSNSLPRGTIFATAVSTSTLNATTSVMTLLVTTPGAVDLQLGTGNQGPLWAINNGNGNLFTLTDNIIPIGNATHRVSALFTSVIDSGSGSLALKGSASTAITITGTSTNVGGVLQSGGIPYSTLNNKSGSGGGDYTTTSNIYADVDAANLALTVTIPNNFKLLVNAAAEIKDNALAAVVGMALFDSSVIAERVIDAAVAGDRETMALTHVITGDGASHTVKLQWKTSAGTATMGNGSATLSPRMTFFMAPSA